MATFFGVHDQTIDAKRRLAISAELREEIDPAEDGEKFILVLGLERHLWLYPDLSYRRLLAKLKRSPFPSGRQQKTLLFFAMARVLKPDAQGRVVLPEKSVQQANVANRVTLIGNDDHIEIWPAEEWQEFWQKHSKDYNENLRELSEGFGVEADAAD